MSEARDRLDGLPRGLLPAEAVELGQWFEIVAFGAFAPESRQARLGPESEEQDHRPLRQPLARRRAAPSMRAVKPGHAANGDGVGSYHAGCSLHVAFDGIIDENP